MEVHTTNNGWRSFMSVAAWSPYHSHTSNPDPANPKGHQRSQSTTTGGPANNLLPSGKPRSNTHYSTTNMDAALAQPGTPQPRRLYAGITEADYDMSTIPDPRSRSMTPSGTDEIAPPLHHPDLNDEVATLSTKLISAINHQTTLDDTLSQTRTELERSREQVRNLEFQLAKQREMLAGDIWVRRKSVEAEKNNLLSRIADEKKLRMDVEQEKKKIEQELENLTAELFEEANKMVISAKEDSRREKDIIQRKNDLLKAQLADTEGLLKSQQEQLAELKNVMEQMGSDRDDTTAMTTPSSPGFSKFESRDDEMPLSDGGSQAGPPELLSPSYPTSFTHLLQPVLRTDLNAYDDFVALCKTSRNSASRPPSGTHTGIGLGLGLVGSVASAGSLPKSASTASLTSAASTGASPQQSPNTSASTFSSASAIPIPPLKDTKFYKRALAEDIEPTLRLDIAPGLSWLARRSVITAMSDGSLVVEPVPTTGVYATLSKPQLYPCSLCGENRKDEEHLRRHRFRTSESSSAQRYPLCKYCLNRVRSTCDFLGFLRIVKDGHWRADDEDAEKAAWEESVKLRDQMFWARIGGGVRPIMQHSSSVGEKSPRFSQEESARLEQEATSAHKVSQPVVTKVQEKDLATAVPEVEHIPEREVEEKLAIPAVEAQEPTPEEKEEDNEEEEEEDFVTPALEVADPTLNVEAANSLAPAQEIMPKSLMVEGLADQASVDDAPATPVGEDSESESEAASEPRTPAPSTRFSAHSLDTSSRDSESSKRLSMPLDAPGIAS